MVGAMVESLTRPARRISTVTAFVAALAMMPAAVCAEALHFRLDHDATEISVAVEEPLSSIRGDAVGKFLIISGDAYEIPADRSKQDASIWVEIIVDAASYNSGSSMRDDAVKSSVLNAQTYPTIVFKGGSAMNDVARTSDHSGSATMKGELFLNGQTRPFEVPAQASLSGDKLTVDANFSFDYTDFGIKPPSFLGLESGRMAKVTFHAIAAKAPN